MLDLEGAKAPDFNAFAQGHGFRHFIKNGVYDAPGLFFSKAQSSIINFNRVGVIERDQLLIFQLERLSIMLSQPL